MDKGEGVSHTKGNGINEVTLLGDIIKSLENIFLRLEALRRQECCDG